MIPFTRIKLKLCYKKILKMKGENVVYIKSAEIGKGKKET